MRCRLKAFNWEQLLPIYNQMRAPAAVTPSAASARLAYAADIPANYRRTDARIQSKTCVIRANTCRTFARLLAACVFVILTKPIKRIAYAWP